MQVVWGNDAAMARWGYQFPEIRNFWTTPKFRELAGNRCDFRCCERAPLPAPFENSPYWG